MAALYSRWDLSCCLRHLEAWLNAGSALEHGVSWLRGQKQFTRCVPPRLLISQQLSSRANDSLPAQ